MKYHFKPIRPPATPKLAVIITLTIIIGVLAALSVIVSNVASTTLPIALKPYVGYSWPALLVLLGLGIVLATWQAWYTSDSSANNGVPTASQSSVQNASAPAIAPTSATQITAVSSATNSQAAQQPLATSQPNAAQLAGAKTLSQASLSHSASGPTPGPGAAPTPAPNSAHYHTCVISYATEDEPFVQKLSADLKAHGVPCWLADQDIKTGTKLRPEIYQAIDQLDKLLLVLSHNAIESLWVEEEVDVALDREHQHPGTWLFFPLRLDDTVFTTKKYWAITVRQRRIGDFRQWQQGAVYQQALQRVLRDLQV